MLQCQQVQPPMTCRPNMCDLASYEAARADLISAIVIIIYSTTCARLFYGLVIDGSARRQGSRCEVGLPCGSSATVKTR